MPHSTLLVRTNAPDKIMKHTLRNEGVAACINLLARFVRWFIRILVKHGNIMATSTTMLRYAISKPDEDRYRSILLQDVSTYIQRQLNISDNQLQDFVEVRVESYAILIVERFKICRKPASGSILRIKL